MPVIWCGTSRWEVGGRCRPRCAGWKGWQARMSETKREYRVGRGKPPVHSRFTKGQSGNPRRPRPDSRTSSTAPVDAPLQLCPYAMGGCRAWAPNGSISGSALSIRSRSRRRGPRYASTARLAGSAWPRIIRRRVISRRVIGRRWVIGRRPVTAVVERRRPRERSERRGDDSRGGNDYGARRADRPGQWRRRVGGIVLRLGGRERQSGEPGGERYRNRNSADTHGSPGLDPARQDQRMLSDARRGEA